MKRLTRIAVLLGAAVFSNLAHAAAILPASGVSVGVSQPRTAEALLAQSKAAMGGAAWDDVRSLRMQGIIEVGGLTGSIGSLRDLADGRWSGSAEVGPIKQSSGFDGKATWRMGDNNELTLHKPPTASDVTDIYQKAYAWWYPKRWPAKIERVGRETSQGTVFDVLRITPQGGVSFDMWINARTHFIDRFVEVVQGAATTVLLGDYRDVRGVELAFRTQTINRTARSRQVTQIKTASINVPVHPGDFATPRPDRDGSAAGNADKVTLPFQFANGYIYVPVTIDGHRLRFMLDTGGPNVLSTRAARALGIVGKGSAASAGLGVGHASQSYTRVKSLTLGSRVTLGDQLFAIQPMQDADGAIGSGLLYDFVVRIDYAARELVLVRPGAFSAAAAGTPLPLQVRGQKPFVQASIGGVPGWFLVDTGANGLVMLNTPFSRKHDLYARFHADPPSSAGHGYNGRVAAREAHGQRFDFGPFRGQLPEFALSTETTGMAAMEHMAGIIGSGVLKHLTVTINYANGTIYLKPAST